MVAQASVDALVGLYQASDEMDAALFTPFSEEILQNHRFIDSLQYLTYIAQDEKKLFIEEMHESGFSQFSIKSPGAGNRLASKSRLLPGHQFSRTPDAVVGKPDGHGLASE